MKVRIKPQDGTKKDEIEMDINPDEIIESVRRRIADKKGIECPKLIFGGKTLKDDETLRLYKVKEGDTVTVGLMYENQYLPMGVTPSWRSGR